MRPGQREAGGGVVEAAAGPRGGRVTGRAGRGESRRQMGRTRGPVIVGLMARSAGRRFPVVDPVGMTGRAGRGEVRPGQREAGGRVVERPAVPRGRRVTGGAGGREPGRLVGRIGAAVVVGLVTRDAGGRLPVVDAVGMTGRAGRGQVRPGQREAGGGVVEAAAGPRGGRVTGRAGRGESRRQMGRTRGPVIVGLMARSAGRRFPVVDPVGMTGRAGRGEVRPGQREAGGRVVERPAVPRGRRVTGGAGGREPGRLVGRIGAAVVVGLVTRDAGGRLPVVDAVGMTGRAGRGQVRPGQRERGGVVIERRPGPGRGRVAGGTGGREPGGLVRGCFGRGVVRLVA